MAISSVASNSVATAPSDATRTFVQAAPITIGSVSSKPAATGGGVSTQAPSTAQVAQAVKQVNDAFTQKGQNLYASIGTDKATGISVVKFQDANTQEVISQYPSKEVIAMADALGQQQDTKGRLIHVSA